MNKKYAILKKQGQSWSGGIPDNGSVKEGDLIEIIESNDMYFVVRCFRRFKKHRSAINALISQGRREDLSQKILTGNAVLEEVFPGSFTKVELDMIAMLHPDVNTDIFPFLIELHKPSPIKKIKLALKGLVNKISKASSIY